MTKMILTLLLMLAKPVQDLPHAFPREGAKQLIDNNRVTVWETTWANGKMTAMHRHKYDMVDIELADSTARVGTPDGNSQPVTFKLGEVNFVDKGLTHFEQSTNSKRHAIQIDLKDVSVPPVPNPTKYPLAFPRPGVKKALENKRVIVWDYTWTPGQPTPMHFHDKDVVVVYLAEGELKSTTVEGKADVNKISFGLTRFNAPNRTHTEELVKGAARAIIVELK